MSILLWQLTHSAFFFAVLTIISFIAGIYICDKTSQDLNVHDDGRIVWDEIVAIFLMFCLLPAYDNFYYLLAFISFRFFDILKPFPIRYFDEKLENGLGIMVDDIFAAIFALAALWLIHFFF